MSKEIIFATVEFYHDIQYLKARCSADMQGSIRNEKAFPDISHVSIDKFFASGRLRGNHPVEMRKNQNEDGGNLTWFPSL